MLRTSVALAIPEDECTVRFSSSLPGAPGGRHEDGAVSFAAAGQRKMHRRGWGSGVDVTTDYAIVPDKTSNARNPGERYFQEPDRRPALSIAFEFGDKGQINREVVRTSTRAG